MDKEKLGALSTAVTLAVQSAVMIIVSVVAGLMLDRFFSTAPWLTVLFAAAGFVATLYSVYKRLV